MLRAEGKLLHLEPEWLRTIGSAALIGYLFAPKERKKDEETNDDETPQWVVEAWEFLLRKEFGAAVERSMLVGFTRPDADGCDYSKRYKVQKARVVRPV